MQKSGVEASVVKLGREQSADAKLDASLAVTLSLLHP